jgi:hypothetical protein
MGGYGFGWVVYGLWGPFRGDNLRGPSSDN